jgi:hypothetical protein
MNHPVSRRRTLLYGAKPQGKTSTGAGVNHSCRSCQCPLREAIMLVAVVVFSVGLATVAPGIIIGGAIPSERATSRA